MLADLGASVLVAFAIFVVVGWGGIVAIGIGKLPGLWVDSLDMLTRVVFRLVRPSAPREVIERWEDRVFVFAMFLVGGAVVLGLTHIAHAFFF